MVVYFCGDVTMVDDTLRLKWLGCTENCIALRRQHVVDGSARTPVSAVTEIKCERVAGPYLTEASDSGSLKYLFSCE